MHKFLSTYLGVSWIVSLLRTCTSARLVSVELMLEHIASTTSLTLLTTLISGKKGWENIWPACKCKWLYFPFIGVHGWPRLVSYHMVEVLNLKFYPLSSKNSYGHFSHMPSHGEIMTRWIHAFSKPEGRPRATVTWRDICVSRPTKQNEPKTSRHTRLNVSNNAHYSFDNSLGIFPTVLLPEEIMTRQNMRSPTSNSFFLTTPQISHKKLPTLSLRIPMGAFSQSHSQ